MEERRMIQKAWRAVSFVIMFQESNRGIVATAHRRGDADLQRIREG
jgi:hypothetical protein